MLYLSTVTNMFVVRRERLEENDLGLWRPMTMSHGENVGEQQVAGILSIE